MGWASGSRLAVDVWALVGKHTPEQNRKQVARELVTLFEEMDCDTMNDAEALMKDAGLHHDDE